MNKKHMKPLKDGMPTVCHRNRLTSAMDLSDFLRERKARIAAHKQEEREPEDAA